MYAPVMVLQVGMVVRVHKNLHRKCWSVLDAKSRRLIAHVTEITLGEVTFKVSEAGRRRVLRRRQRNVHANARGIVLSLTAAPLTTSIRYNPYEAGTFLNNRGEAVVAAAKCSFRPDGAFI